MKISTKLYTGFFLVVALTAALGFYISYVNNKFLIEDSGRDAVFQSEEIIKRFDQAIHDKIMEVGAATKRSWVKSIVAESNAIFEELESIDAHLTEMESQWTAVSGEKANALQQERMSNSLANELRDEFITFYEAMRGQRFISNLIVTNKYGASIAQTDETDHFRYDTEMWWQETRRLGMYSGQTEFAKGSISASFRINDAKGNFIGVLKTVIDIKAQISAIEMTSMDYQTTQTTMLTMDGKVIYRTRPYRFMEDFSTWQYFARLQGKENSFVGVSEGNKKKLYSFSRSRDNNRRYGFGWILILESDLDDIMAPAHALRNHIAIISLLLIFLGTAIAFLISSSITRSLTKINKGASRVGAGDLDYLLETEGKDEFSQLACSFNTMVRNLQKITASRDELNHEIKERKQAEKLLLRSNTLLTSVIDQAPFAIHILEGEINSISVMIENNESVRIMGESIAGRTGIDADIPEMLSTCFFDIDGIQEIPLNSMPSPRAFSGEIVTQEEYLFHHANGNRIMVEASASPVYGKNQQIIAVVVMFQDITKRKQIESQINTALKEKEVLFREIHHRIKNNMQIIQSLLNLQANAIQETKYKKLLIDSNNRIKSMALIHETLYRSEDMKNLDVESYFNEIIQHLLKIYQKQEVIVDFNIEIKPAEMDMDLCIACGLILNELVSNSLKYAFNSDAIGRIFIILRKTDKKQGIFIITDNGCGLPVDFNIEKSDSLGLKIVKILSKGQMGGKFSLLEDSGTSFEIIFPLLT